MININLITLYSNEHTEALRDVFFRSRCHAFYWVNPSEFQLGDFDQSIVGENVLVAVHESRPVGFVSWWAPGNFIHNLFVDPDFHGQGIGTALLDSCLKVIGRPATLKCLTANQSAMDFYLRKKWTVVEKGDSTEGEFLLLRAND
ncbi:GNAT family N-acetyltransferase [Dyadobacter chenhuakuii]|uniref:GNAT family N-acetyltransferase n=1 Tax=Dyadobacter chenhuakuii TaxID=2909339 RepID=A0A9X1TWK7_9BACT|nr:GNAT family N-acetyltransferase [Dyadobacter chenhuakuii]MCF2501202.1 GNAT family N-acetyltransferase [Dyadobacter chenhuakuii]